MPEFGGLVRAAPAAPASRRPYADDKGDGGTDPGCAWGHGTIFVHRAGSATRSCRLDPG